MGDGVSQWLRVFSPLAMYEGLVLSDYMAADNSLYLLLKQNTVLINKIKKTIPNPVSVKQCE